jgi:cytochrome P450
MTKSIYGAVSDWRNDFDHADPAYNENAHEIWQSLRGECPMAHTKRYGGAWLPLSYEMIRAIAYDTEHFSSDGIIVGSDRPIVPRPIGSAPPITSDPPFHNQARRILLPPFSSKRIALLEKSIRELCQELLNSLDLKESNLTFDASNQYARHIPLNVIVKMLGLPKGDSELLFSFIKAILEDVNLTPEQLVENRNRLDSYLDIQIEDHRKNPRDDLISYLVNTTIDGEPLDEQHIRGAIGLMFIAGVDTTWSMIGSSIWHLASHPEDLKKLIQFPDLIDSAVEEFLRAYAPVTMARLVKEDFDFFGHQLKKDDWVLVPYPAANRDPAAFENADTVQLDRKINRHAAFGLGIHRCIGSNLARLELKIAIEEFIKYFPVFELANPSEVKWSSGQIRGPRKLDIRILSRQ